MPKLTCYLPDELAKRLQQKARAASLPVSRYLSRLIRKDLESRWPHGYFDLFGGWQGEPLRRPEQGELESRAGLD